MYHLLLLDTALSDMESILIAFAVCCLGGLLLSIALLYRDFKSRPSYSRLEIALAICFDIFQGISFAGLAAITTQHARNYQDRWLDFALLWVFQFLAGTNLAQK
ncbi:hypothetical protein BCR34DRAFT_607967 [Clohesyomyces aquaticus]|uniref:Uncharacterized protein n=1 Tax=Clohesyomyces aquaticus TaxID=1231657 RepID=A0A1Y1YBL9_9PLEO|nr:hypothetical protein BCR34DRAFT_607967 [Clohesyomyces aquaticus]